MTNKFHNNLGIKRTTEPNAAVKITLLMLRSMWHL